MKPTIYKHRIIESNDKACFEDMIDIAIDQSWEVVGSPFFKLSPEGESLYCLLVRQLIKRKT